MRLDALVYATDLISLNINSIRQIAIRYGKNITEITFGERIILASFIWSVIDQCHVLRQLFKELLGHTADPNNPAPFEIFNKKYETVSRLRNKMDHLNQAIPNLAASKNRSPIYGAFSYFHATPEDIRQEADGSSLVSGRVITITFGTLANQEKIIVLNPAGRKLMAPVGGLHFNAFDEVVFLDELLEDLKPIVTDIEKQAEEQLTAQLQQAAKERGIPIEKLSVTPAAGLTTVLEMSFGPAKIQNNIVIKDNATLPATSPSSQ